MDTQCASLHAANDVKRLIARPWVRGWAPRERRRQLPLKSRVVGGLSPAPSFMKRCQSSQGTFDLFTVMCPLSRALTSVNSFTALQPRRHGLYNLWLQLTVAGCVQGLKKPLFCVHEDELLTKEGQTHPVVFSHNDLNVTTVASSGGSIGGWAVGAIACPPHQSEWSLKSFFGNQFSQFVVIFLFQGLRNSSQLQIYHPRLLMCLRNLRQPTNRQWHSYLYLYTMWGGYKHDVIWHYVLRAWCLLDLRQRDYGSLFWSFHVWRLHVNVEVLRIL